MINVILVDDEPMALKSLEWELNNFCQEVHIKGVFTNPEHALDFLEHNTIDAVFLDIEMPQMDGFQFIEKVKPRKVEVIITTAYDNFAIKAIKQRALDYLLKPIDSDDLVAAVAKLVSKSEEKSLAETLEETLLNLSKEQRTRKISIPIEGRIVFIDPKNIVYCESDGNYTTIHMQDKSKLLVSKKIKEVSQKLEKDHFFRIHNSYVINMSKVVEFFRNENYVILENNIKLPVSRQKKSSFLDMI
ncbi:LytR/AlgR family response regulator transcription factor [Flavobacteriaceae bacterium M23B6Z8]